MSESGEPNVPPPDPETAALHAEIEALRLIIERERLALRGTHEEHATQLTEQAATLGETFATLSSLALRGFERAEGRLAALEQDLRGRMAQLSRDIQTVVAELRSARPQSAPGPAAPFPLESVMRIHEELRETDDDTVVSGADALKAGLSAFSRPPAEPEPALPPPPEPTQALATRLEVLERAVGDVTSAAVGRKAEPRSTYFLPALAALAAVVLLLVVAGVLVQRRMEARLNEATVRISAAEQQRDAAGAAADARLAAARRDAEQQVAVAHQSAAQAQVVGTVLAAPDLVRYWLLGKGQPRPYAQVVFSRSRGMVFSAARLPAVPSGKTYQLWLLSRGGPVSAGLMAPDKAGRVTYATDVPVSVPKRLTGALLTLEAAQGAARPGGTSILVRVP